MSKSLLLAVLLVFSSFVSASSNAEPNATHDRPLVVGYFPQWGILSQPQYLVKNLVSSGGVSMLDQLNYSQGAVDGGHCSIANAKADLAYTFSPQESVDGSADNSQTTFHGNLHQLEELKQRNPKLKILISLEGSAKSFAEDAQPQNRYVFVASCVDTFLRGRFANGILKPGIFDGIDVDWEYPNQEDATNYIALITEFRRQMDLYKKGMRLSIAIGATPAQYPGVDMAAVSKIADQIAVMNYDYAGPWSKTTGIIAPLYTDIADPTAPGSVDATITAYKNAGVPSYKILMGIPFYAYGWNQVPPENHGLYQSGVAIHGDKSYSFVRELIPNSTLYRDPRTQAPWLYDGQTFWTFEDPTSIRFKVNYSQHQKLGGIMIWELSGDMPDASLLTAAYSQLTAPDSADNEIQTAGTNE
jgi:chitinase